MSCVTLSGNLRRVVSIASFLLVKADRRENKAPKVTNVGRCSVFVSRKMFGNKLPGTQSYSSFPLEYFIATFLNRPRHSLFANNTINNTRNNNDKKK